MKPAVLETARRLAESSTEDCAKAAATGTGVGVVTGLVAVPLVFLALGLTPIGPIAGGWFAANMGAGVAAGSGMAALQSAAMTGAGYGTAAAVGGTVGAGVGTAVSC